MSTSAGTAIPSGKIKIFVSILPQAYFVERIGGPLVDVTVMVGEGQSPATYEPTPKGMTELGRSHIYFRIGTPFEKHLIDKIYGNFKNLKIVDMRRGVPLRYFKSDHPKETGQADPHIWLNPRYVKIQAVTICEALCEIYPESSLYFVANLQGLLTELDELDARIANILEAFKGKNIYVFHPAFGYFCDAYGMKQVTIEIEGKVPSAKQLTSIIRKAKAEKVKTIFVQSQYAKQSAAAVANAIGGVLVQMNPLPREYMKNMEKMANIIKISLEKQDSL
jgi:zinc transport system substrate-binding protein